MLIKSAAVPHYSRSNGKVFYAVRVCPANTLNNPYTVYRRWDEFLDFSAKLAADFPTSTPDPEEKSTFRRVPRLSRKVTLFVTASTHCARRDELDLFVRHLFSAPRAVTSSLLVRNYFSIKANGLDGQLPPSPTPLASPSFEVSSKQLSAMTRDRETAYASIRERSPAVESVFHPTTSFGRPGLASKRSTPDLRRFINADSSDDELVASNASPYPSPLTFRFPARACPPTPPTSLSPPPMLEDNDETIRFSAHIHRTRTSNASSHKPRVGLALDTFEEPYASPELRQGSSDTSSMRTASTIRPTLSRASSRIASALSFSSDQAVEEETAPSRPTRPRPGPGALKHFRSLQDIRSVVTPRPQLPSQESFRNVHVPPPMSRSRSDSRILAKPLPQVAEDEPPHAASPASRSYLTRQPTVEKQSKSSSNSNAKITRPSLNNLRRAQQSLVRSYSHQHTPSNSSIESNDSSSSVSLTRSQSSSATTSSRSAAGLGLDFSTSSYESLDFSDHSSYLDSPDSSFTPPTPPSGRFEQSKFEKWQHDTVNGAFIYNNHLPPLPFFPTPDACDMAQQQHQLHQQQQMQSSRRYSRRRASSLHQPVLETILASPVLGSEPEQPTVMIKLMTDKGNFLMKVAKAASLREVREKISAKCRASDIQLERQFGLAVSCSAAGADTTKASRLLDTAKSSMMTLSSSGGSQASPGATVDLQDEEDWQLALSLATTKIILRVV